MMKPHPPQIWQFKNPDLNESLTLAAELGISPLIAQLLMNRGQRTAADARRYLYPRFDELHSPFKLADMDKAVDRIRRAIKRGEKIYIYGDYDADGTTATALLYNAFRHMDVPVGTYIPNRFRDGYGLSQTTVEEIHRKGGQLLITVDCGITSKADVELANSLGMDVIITDHHQPNPEVLPPAYALVSPRVEGNEYPYPNLAGVGLAYKLAQGLIEDKVFLTSLLDLVALGTVADLVPLTGENRVLSRLGLDVLNQRERPGVKALCKISGFKSSKELIGENISFGLAPRINASGRMGTAARVVELLTTESGEVAERIASELDETNRERKTLEAGIRDNAEQIIKAEMDETTVGMVVASDVWGEKAQGVVGIVASSLLKTYHKPVFVLSIKGEEATGSGRCIEGMNLADVLESCSDLLMTHGGHAAAAGVTLKSKNIPAFKHFFNEYARKKLSSEALQPKLELDFETPLSLLTFSTLEEFAQLEPFGQENPFPRFSAAQVKIGTSSAFGKDKKHLKMYILDGNRRLPAVAWRKGKHLVTLKRKEVSLDIAFSPQINEWGGIREVQLSLEDWRFCSNNRPMKRQVFPTERDASRPQIVDGRGKNKKDYLLNLLSLNEPCILYVQNRKMLEHLRTDMIPEEAPYLGLHDESMSVDEEATLLKKLEQRELKVIASSANFSQLNTFPFVKYFIFCHLTAGADVFFERCRPAFSCADASELHLIYNESDFKRLMDWISQKYPAESVLRDLYKNLRGLIQPHGSDGFPEAELMDGKLGAVASIQTALTIFEELGFLKRDGDGSDSRIQLLTPEKRGLPHSRTYLRGEWIKQTSDSFVDFQLQGDIKPIWERVENECRLTNQPNSEL